MNPSDVSRQLADRLARTPGKLGQTPGRTVQLTTADPGETPFEVCHEEPIVRLRRYEPRVPADEVRDVPLVIAYPFINDPSILDFAPDRSVIRAFLDRGFPVYVAEWTDASPIDRSIGLGDVVDRYLRNCIDAVRKETESDDIHLLGYSVSAPLAAGYAALHPDTVRTLILQGPPLAFDAGADADMDLFHNLAAEHDPEQVAEAFDTVPTTLLEAALLLRKPVEFPVTSSVRLWDRLDDEEYVEETGRKLAWLVGGPDIPGAVYREYVDELILGDRLLESNWQLNGRDVDLDRIDMPTLLLLAREDKFVPREASVPFLDAIPSDDATTIELPVKHVGLSIAPEAHESGWPQVCEWIESRSDTRTQADDRSVEPTTRR